MLESPEREHFTALLIFFSTPFLLASFVLNKARKPLSRQALHTSAKSLLSLRLVLAIFSPIYEMIEEDRLLPRNSVQLKRKN